MRQRLRGSIEPAQLRRSRDDGLRRMKTSGEGKVCLLGNHMVARTRPKAKCTVRGEGAGGGILSRAYVNRRILSRDAWT